MGCKKNNRPPNTMEICCLNSNLVYSVLKKGFFTLIDWYYRTLSVQLGSNAVRMFSIYVLEIPIPPVGQDDIYKAYSLNASEIAYIENIKV